VPRLRVVSRRPSDRSPRRPTSRLLAGVATGALGIALLGHVDRLSAQTRPDSTRTDSTRRDSVRTDSVRADSLSPDSLLARLVRAEAAIALLRQQLAIESETAVHTRSRIGVELFARVVTNVGYNVGAVNDPSLPLSVLAPGAPKDPSLGISLRQTRLGAAVTVRDVLGGTFDSDVDVDFFGGGRDANGNRPLFPEPRLRTLRAMLRWPHTTVLVGSETPLISDLDPLSLAAVGTPEFSGAGNLWNWLAQVRLTQELGGRAVRFSVQGAVLEPYAASIYDPTRAGGGDAGERSGRPFVEGRLRARWGPEDPDAPGADVRAMEVGDGASEIGIGVHRGTARLNDANTPATTAVSLDARLVLVRHVELRGEAYTGQLLAGLGGGAIGAALGRPPVGAPAGTLGAPLRDRAAWAQLNVQPTVHWLAGVGCGIDRVRDADRPDRRQNTVCMTHVRWRPVEPLLLGVEYRTLSTLYSTGMAHAQHFNLALGVDF
jgi:hypothetical protein